MYGVPGTRRPATITATFTWDSNLKGGEDTATDYVRLAPFWAYLVIDSDNNNGLETPDGSPEERAVAQQAPGKIIAVNHGDVDMDGIPDYADLDVSGASEPPPMVPVLLRLESHETTLVARVRFDYGGILPTTEEFAGTDIGGGFRDYTTAKKGTLRLWHISSPTATRTAADFIETGRDYSASELGLSGGTGQVTLYAEGINEGAPDISATVTFTLEGGSEATFTDTAGISVVEPAILFNCTNDSIDDNELPNGVPDVDFDINDDDEMIKHQADGFQFWWRDPEAEGEDITEETLVDAEPFVIQVPQLLIDHGFQFRLQAKGLAEDSEVRIYPAASPGGDGGNRLLYVTTPQYAMQQVNTGPVAVLTGTTPQLVQLAAGVNEFVALFKKKAGADVQDIRIAMQMVRQSGVPLSVADVRRVIAHPRRFWTEFNCRNGTMRAVPSYPVDDRPVPPGGVRTDPNMQCYPAFTVNPQGLPFPAAPRPHAYYFIFVHGYNANEASARKYNDILFKNMYFALGFRGHYVGFLWEGNAWHDLTNSIALFRPNVKRALQSGLPFYEAMMSLNQQTNNNPQNIDVMAHSLGNLVVWEGARLLERANARQYARSYTMVEAAVQSEVFRPEGPYTNSDGLVYNVNDLRTHSWAFWFNQTGHNTSGVFNRVYNSYNAGDTVLTKWMRRADWAKSLSPPRAALHHWRNNLDPLHLVIPFPPYPLRSLTGTTNAPNPNPPPANLPDSTWYALHQVPALMQNRALLYGSGNLTLPIGAVASPQAQVPANWVMNNAAAQGWQGHSAAWDRPLHQINQWYMWLVTQQQQKSPIQKNKW